jgi:hypothetical protein
VTSGAIRWVVLPAVLAACEPTPAPLPIDAASPNASILPSPLASQPEQVDAGEPADASTEKLLFDSSGRPVVAETSAPVVQLPPNKAIPAENPTGREVQGVSLVAVWHWRDVPAPPKSPEVSAEGIKEAAKLTAFTWNVDLTENGRMRVEFASRAFPLAAFAELRQRADRFGSIIVWPSSSDYRVIPAGALRTVLGERRVDVTPLSSGTARAQGEGKKLGFKTRKVELTSTLGSLRLEIGKVPEAGEGGPLLCRALIEIAGIDPKSSVCQPSEVPLGAVFTWQEGGGISIEATSLTKKFDLASNNLLVPPPGGAHMSGGLPASPDGVFLTRAELAAFRTGAQGPPGQRDPSAPGEGFVAVNHTDVLTYFLLDGVPVVAVPPSSERTLVGTARGKYTGQWRTFLGERVGPARVVELPARVVHGTPPNTPDAGAPDGGP